MNEFLTGLQRFESFIADYNHPFRQLKQEEDFGS